MTDLPQADEDWPILDYWELDQFFRELRAAVVALEQAFTEGSLRARLADRGLKARVGSEILQSYERLAGDDPTHLHRLRIDAVHALLDQAREEIFNIREYAQAVVEDSRMVPRVDPETGAVRSVRQIRLVRASLGGGAPEAVRLDQMLAARFWGLGFQFDDVETTNEVAREVARSTAARLGRDLRHLQKVLLRFRPSDPSLVVRMVPRPEERGFEQLMLDVLNEERACARAAPLSEDFLEKTDLRVRYPGLARKRGGRVQVTQITDPALHRGKLDKIRWLDQFVVLSPLTLARFVDQQVHRPDDEHRALHHFDLDSFWRCLPDLPQDVDALAFTIKRLLLLPLRNPRRHPRGPLSQVPWALRQVVRIYVKHDVFRATRALRDHEALEAAGGSQER